MWVQVPPPPQSSNPYPHCDSRETLNPIAVPNYSDITHNLVLAQDNYSVNRMITQSTSTT
ncbi:MAG: hypothetical protein P5680_24295 [Limnospira sp. PMC 737.11]|nr:hypothetical protein [Limnospira sp. PMC 737.11]